MPVPPYHHLAAVALAFALAFSLGACSPLVVKHDYDPDADFSAYRSFAWLPDPPADPNLEMPGRSPLLGKHIRQAVNRVLDQHGLQKDLDAPDLLVAYHSRLRRRRDVDVYTYGYWAPRAVDVDQHHEDVLVLDFVDRRTNQLVWRGWSVETIDFYASDPRRQRQRLQKAVEEILKRYPQD